MIFQDRLTRMKEELLEFREDLEGELRDMPEGTLNVYTEGDRHYYYERIPKTGNRKKVRRKAITSDPDRVTQLTRKKYLCKATAVLDSDISLIDQTLQDYQPFDEQTVMAGFLEEYPELESGIYRKQPDSDLWQNALPSMKYHDPKRLQARAPDGTATLSKNEMYIAARLEHFGLIYRHDCATGIPGLYRFPDFQILRPRDRKVIYWEHFGMMDDLEYRIDYKRKMKEYEAAGIVPWDNLMITYSKTKYDLDGVMIDAMIRAWLL